MKLLVFTEYFPTSEDAEVTGGVEVRALGLLRELAKKHRVTVICSWQERQQRISTVAGIEVIRVGMMSPYSNTGNIIPRLVYAGAAFITGLLVPKPDVIDGYSYLNYPIAALVGRIRNAAVVLTYHESWSMQEWIKLEGWLTGTFGA
ncbi:glycosyltransferase, partial [Candidatus Woesearchaeota archaeon]|nr:glycosyltransferase [Candidatus Woesearchaeota archaeon]